MKSIIASGSISFIDAVPYSVPMKEDPERAELKSGVNSLMRLTAAIVAISNRFAADRFTTAEGCRWPRCLYASCVR